MLSDEHIALLMADGITARKVSEDLHISRTEAVDLFKQAGAFRTGKVWRLPNLQRVLNANAKLTAKLRCNYDTTNEKP